MLNVENIGYFKNERWILKNLSFQIAQGQKLTLKGANGSGKTTLLKIIGNLLPKEKGQITWKNKVIQNEDIHYFGHKAPLDPELRAFEMMQFWYKSQNYKISGAQIHEQLELFKIPPPSFISKLSQGQKKRLFLSYFLYSSAQPIWLMDEIFTNLDHEASILLDNFLDKHLQEGGIAILSAHENIEIKPGIEIYLS